MSTINKIYSAIDRVSTKLDSSIIIFNISFFRNSHNIFYIDVVVNTKHVKLDTFKYLYGDIIVFIMVWNEKDIGSVMEGLQNKYPSWYPEV